MFYFFFVSSRFLSSSSFFPSFLYRIRTGSSSWDRGDQTTNFIRRKPVKLPRTTLVILSPTLPFLLLPGVCQPPVLLTPFFLAWFSSPCSLTLPHTRAFSVVSTGNRSPLHASSHREANLVSYKGKSKVKKRRMKTKFCLTL